MAAPAQPEFALDETGIAAGLAVLQTRDSRLARAIAQLGPPPVRRRDPGFATLIRILAGQQVSVPAAEGIWRRLCAHLGAVTPDQVARAETLPGLSSNKIRYARALAEAVQTGQLDVDGLAAQTDEAVVAAITQVTGFGRWSAEMYLMFALGRPDIWPAGDLAVRAGFARLMDTASVPDQKAIAPLADPYRPHRSTLALLCWHAYSAPAL